MARTRINGIVLLVEDEPSLRLLLRRMMELYGLTVVPVETQECAIELSQSMQERIDVLVTDLQLPGMSGLELATIVRRERPGLPVVFISGYPREDAFGLESREYAHEEFLQKPFTPAHLIAAIRRVLGID